MSKETTSAMTTLHARLVAMQVLVSQLTQAHLTDDKEHEIWWFFILILVSAIFVVYFAVHAVLFANVHQHTLASAALLCPSQRLRYTLLRPLLTHTSTCIGQAFELGAFLGASLMLIVRIVFEYLARKDDCTDQSVRGGSRQTAEQCTNR